MSDIKMNKLALAVAIAASAAMVTGCGGSSSSSGGGGGTLQMHGGIGGNDGGDGGDGEYFQIDNYGTGDILIGNGKRPDASFTKTNLNSVDMSTGSNGVTISTDTSPIFTATFAGKPAAGVLYVTDNTGDAGGFRLRISDGNTGAFSNAEIVTGIEIERGATLTLPLNAGNYARIDLANDIIVKGTLTAAELSPASMPTINLFPSSVYIYSSGTIDNSGTQEGQDGGYLDIQPNYAFINHGSVLTYGADNSAGAAGDAGEQYVYADYYFENTGLMDAHGGDSADDQGGDAGWIDVYANYGDMNSSGDVLAYGGDGETGGGDGDDVYFYADSIGDVNVSGTVAVYGGDAGASAGADGGDADYVEFYSYGGSIESTARIQGWGGSTLAADGDGGDGAYLDIYNYDGGHYETSPLEGVNFAGNIQLQGGDAQADGTGNGGDSDSIYVYIADESSSNPEAGQDAIFHFSRINMQGGDGNYPGDGGDLYIYNYEIYSNPLDVYISSGNNDLRATFNMYGGDVVDNATNNATGGAGGESYIESDYYEALATPDRGMSIVRGNINAYGGESFNATNDDADAEYHWLWGYNGVSFKNYNVYGGDDRAADGGTDGYGGEGSDPEMYSELGDVIGGTINMSGGYGEYRGGDTQEFDAEGHTHRYTLIMNGGDADPDLAGSTGGDVDDVYIWSQQGPSGASGVNLQRSVGAGETDGDDSGTYVILGASCTGDDC